MDVHPLRADEAIAVAATLRHRVVVADRLERQRRDECLYLVAWVGGTPVGQALLHGRRPPALCVADAVDDLPYLEDVFVVPEHRNRGIGTALLAAAEREAAARGHTGVSLAVSIGNSGARRLYARLGYVDAGVPIHRQPSSDPASAGPGWGGSENVVDLVKGIDRLAVAVGTAGAGTRGPAGG
jgi:GNAT superfamily N-acetyltransferase